MTTEDNPPLRNSAVSPAKCSKTVLHNHIPFRSLETLPKTKRLYILSSHLPSNKSSSFYHSLSHVFPTISIQYCLLVVVFNISVLGVAAHPASWDNNEAAATNVGTHNASLASAEGEISTLDRLAKIQDFDSPKLQALLRDIWHWRTQDSPEFATMVGLNDNTAGRLDAFTPAHFTTRKDECLRFLSRAEELEESALAFEDQVNLKILQHYLQTYVDNFEYIKLYTPVTLLEGPHERFPALVLQQMLLDSYDDFQKLLSRYGGFPRQVAELTDILQQNIHEGLVPHSAVLEGVADRLSAFSVSVSESEFFKPFVELPDTISTVQRRTLRQQAQERIAQDVIPSYEKLHQFFQEHYLPAGRQQPGLVSVEGVGKEAYAATLRYHTTTNLSPSQIHSLGLTEIKRIQPLLRQALVDAGWAEGDTAPLAALLQASRERPDRYFQSVAELHAAIEDSIEAVLSSNLEIAFDSLPLSPVSIGNSSGAALACRLEYSGAALEGPARDAILKVDISHLHLIGPNEVRALVLYTTVPGRHLLSEHLRKGSGLPTYRRVLHDVRKSDAPGKLPVYSSFLEGWSLYGLYLGDELDLFQDPFHRLGRQSQEALDAALLVVDTGVHDLGWSLAEATTYLLENTMLSAPAITHALRRVLTWPGLSTAAKVGEIKLKELRQKSVNTLGELFKLQDFHRVVLKCAGPISVLQLCIDHYINAVTTRDAMESSSSPDESTSSHDERETRSGGQHESRAPENVPPDNSSASCSFIFWPVFYPLVVCMTALRSFWWMVNVAVIV